MRSATRSRRLRPTRSGSTCSTPVSVNAAGTEVTVDLNTSTITPGLYDIMLNADFSQSVTAPNYLSGAYTVTAAR